MKPLIVAICIAALSGCGRFSDTITTSMDGYVVKCIEGTKYVMMTSTQGQAITPLVNTDGKPKGCGSNNDAK